MIVEKTQLKFYDFFELCECNIIEQLDRKTLNELIYMIYVIDKNNIKIEFKNI